MDVNTQSQDLAKKIFSERLVALREATGMSQAQAAERAQMIKPVYQRYEYGTRLPSFHQLIALADCFDVSLDYLVGRSDDPRRLP